MDGAGEELLPVPVSPRRRTAVPGSGELHLGQGALERGALADNFLKIEFTANFFLEVELFFGGLFFRASIS